MLTFEPLRLWFKANNKQRTDMYKDCGFAPQTVAKIWNDRFPIRTDIIDKICNIYDLQIEQVIKHKKADSLEIEESANRNF